MQIITRAETRRDDRRHIARVQPTGPCSCYHSRTPTALPPRATVTREALADSKGDMDSSHTHSEHTRRHATNPVLYEGGAGEDGGGGGDAIDRPPIPGEALFKARREGELRREGARDRVAAAGERYAE